MEVAQQWKALPTFLKIFAGTDYNISEHFYVSFAAGTAFINGQTLAAIRPGIGFYLSDKKRFAARLGYSSIFNRDSFFGAPVVLATGFLHIFYRCKIRDENIELTSMKHFAASLQPVKQNINTMKRYCIFLTVVIFSVSTFAQSWPDTVALIEKTMSRYQLQNPGCQLSVSRNGEIIFSKAWGMADMEHSVALTLNHVTEAGSVSKQFTAAAILLLEQQGKLLLNDDVRKYIPQLPDYGVPVTLEQMMHHTSGLRDWGAVAAITGWPRSTKTYDNDDALEIIRQQKKLNNIPGAEFIYSNSNYNLLAIVVQRVSGLSLAEFTHKHIFTPAGMTHTGWRDNHKTIVSNRAMAYARTAKGYETDMPNEDVYGNGGLLTTTEDLLKWNQYYSSGKFGNPSLLPKQIAVTPFSNGFINNYGAGLFINKTAGMDYITHSGSTASYRANLDYIPDLKLCIAFLSNTSQFDISPINIATAVRNIFVQNASPVPAPKSVEQPIVAAQQLEQFTGWYKNNRSGNALQIIVKDKNLVVVDGGKLVPVDNNIFTSNNNRIIFSRRGLQYIIPEKDTILYSKVHSAKRSFTANNDYSGKYYGEETQSFILVSFQNDTLKIHIKPGWDFQLIPTYEDGFNVPALGGNLYFERDKKNECIRLKISNGRARNVEFRKVE